MAGYTSPWVMDAVSSVTEITLAAPHVRPVSAAVGQNLHLRQSLAVLVVWYF